MVRTRELAALIYVVHPTIYANSGIEESLSQLFTVYCAVPICLDWDQKADLSKDINLVRTVLDFSLSLYSKQMNSQGTIEHPLSNKLCRVRLS
jgi:hypothetical protein